MYGDDSDENDSDDILGPIIDEFSIKEDVNVQNFMVEQPASGKGTTKNGKKAPTATQKQEFTSYSNLKNNYLGRIQSPLPT